MEVTPSPAAIFARVSTSKQNTDRQVRDLEASITPATLTLVATIVEVVSGNSRRAERPQLQELLHLARTKQIKVVLVTEISRLGRRTVEVLQVVDELTELGVAVWVMNYGLSTLTPQGKRNPMASLLFTLLAEFAQLERETTVERITSGLAEAKRKGKVLGRPVGYTKDDQQILKDYPKVVELLNAGVTIRRISEIAQVSDKTVQKVKRILTGTK